MVKFPRENEAMVIDEDPFPLVTSINIVAFDLKALINSEKEKRVPLSPKTRKVWILKQYLIYKDDFIVERRVFVVKEKNKNGEHPNHSFGKKKSRGLE